MAKLKQYSFFYRNGLSLMLIALFVIFITGQAFTGWHEHNKDLTELGSPAMSLATYLSSGHFIQTTFENWESEFLQMMMYVLLTIKLRQLGSSESKKLDEAEEVDRKPNPRKKDAPLPVKLGGWQLALYRNSLSLAFALLFLISFVLHACGSFKNFNEEQLLQGKAAVSVSAFMTGSRFWFESFQNWQSEFIAVFSIVILSVFLRQHGSPESKPVDASNSETGSG